MIKAKAITTAELYKTNIVSNEGLNLIVDEPITNGGKGLGFSPKELLCASLASCTSITIRMYVNHKKWEVTEISVNVELKQEKGEIQAFLYREIEVKGNLSEEQKERLMTIANSCPVHKMLRQNLEIQSKLI